MVFLLEKWYWGNNSETLPIPKFEDNGEWEIEKIHNERKIQDKLYYFVKWKGWPSEYNQWVPESNMDNTKDTIHQFRKGKNKTWTT